MNKYFHFAKNIMQETFAYRVNFIMWRVRGVFSLLTLYYLWYSLLPAGKELFGYSQSLLLTYTMLGSIAGSFVFATRANIMGDEINSGDLSNYLIKPMNYFYRIFFIDIGDKIMNILFSSIELTILFFILKPPVIFQTDWNILIYFFLSLILALFLHFFIQLLLSSIGFWSNEIWAPRFIFGILVQFFAGGIFPLDILPTPLYNFFMATPFPYLLYFPLKIYLGQLSLSQIIYGILMTGFWIAVCYIFVFIVWRKGLKMYSAQGR